MRDSHPYLDFAPGVLALRSGHASSDDEDDSVEDDGGNDGRDRASHRPLHLLMARPELSQDSSIRSGSVFADSLSRESTSDYTSDQDSSAPSMAFSTSSTRSATRRRKLHPWEMGSGTMESLLDDKPKDKNSANINGNKAPTTRKKKWGSATESAVTKPSVVATSSSRQISTHTDPQKLKFIPNSTHARSFTGGTVKTEKERLELSARSTQSRTRYASTEMRRQSSGKDHVSGGFSFTNADSGNSRNQAYQESSTPATANVPITASNVFSSLMGYAIDPIPEKLFYNEAGAESIDSMPVKPPTLKALFRLQEEEVEEDFEHAKVKQGIELARHTQKTKQKTSYEVDAPRLTNTAVQPEVEIRGLDSGNWKKAKLGQELDEFSDSDSDASQSMHSLDDMLHPDSIEGHTDHHAHPGLDDSILSLHASAIELDAEQDILGTSREIREEAEDQLENLDHAAAVINTFNDILEQAEREQQLLDYAMEETLPSLEPIGSLMEDDANGLSHHDNQALRLFLVDMMKSVDENLQPAKAKLTDLFKWSEKQNVDVVERSKHREYVVKVDQKSKRISRSDALFVLPGENTVGEYAKDRVLLMKPIVGPSLNLDNIHVTTSTSVVKQESSSPAKNGATNASELESRREDTMSDYQGTNDGNSRYSIGKGLEGENGRGKGAENNDQPVVFLLQNTSLKTVHDKQNAPRVDNLKMPSNTATLHVVKEAGTGKVSNDRVMSMQKDEEEPGEIYVENLLTPRAEYQAAQIEKADIEPKRTKQVHKKTASSTQQVKEAFVRKRSLFTDTPAEERISDEFAHVTVNSARKALKKEAEIPVLLGQVAIPLDAAGNQVHDGEIPIAQKEESTKHQNQSEKATTARHASIPRVRPNAEKATSQKVSPRTSSKPATLAGAAIGSKEQSRSREFKLSSRSVSKATPGLDADTAKGLDQELLSNTAKVDSYKSRLQGSVVENGLDSKATSSLSSSRAKGIVEPTLIDEKQRPLEKKLALDSDKNRQQHVIKKDTNYEKSVSTSRSSDIRGGDLDHPAKPIIMTATKERIREKSTVARTTSLSDTVSQGVVKPLLVNELKKSSSLRRRVNNQKDTKLVPVPPAEETDPFESLSITPEEVLAALRGRPDIDNRKDESALGSPVQDSDPFLSLSISPDEVLAALRGGSSSRKVRDEPTKNHEVKRSASSHSKSRSPVRPLKGERRNTRDVSPQQMTSQGVDFVHPASAETGDKSSITPPSIRKARPHSESNSKRTRSPSPKKRLTDTTRPVSCAPTSVSNTVSPKTNQRKNGRKSLTSVGTSSNSSSVRPRSSNRKSDGSTSRRSRSSIEGNSRRTRRTDLSRGSSFTSSDDDSIAVTKPTFRKAPSRRPQHEGSNQSAASGCSNVVISSSNARRSTLLSSTSSNKKFPQFPEEESSGKNSV